jgi:hypothetical protein
MLATRRWHSWPKYSIFASTQMTWMTYLITPLTSDLDELCSKLLPLRSWLSLPNYLNVTSKWTTWITYFLCFCYADDLDELVLSYMTKENGDWVCTACGFTKRRKDYVVDHVEAKVRLPFSYRFHEILGNGFFYRISFVFESMWTFLCFGF